MAVVGVPQRSPNEACKESIIDIDSSHTLSCSMTVDHSSPVSDHCCTPVAIVQIGAKLDGTTEKPNGGVQIKRPLTSRAVSVEASLEGRGGRMSGRWCAPASTTIAACPRRSRLLCWSR